MNYKYLFLILLFTKAITSQAQKVNLKLTDSLKSSIEIAYIKIYCNKNDDKLSSYHIIRNSYFIIPGSVGCNTIKIEITAPGYEEYYRVVKLTDFLKDTLKKAEN